MRSASTNSVVRTVPLGMAHGVLICIALAIMAGSAHADPPAHGPSAGNGAWVYDALYHDGKRDGRDPGSFAAALNQYNQQAQRGSAITRVFPYGGDLEMYCPHKASSCTAEDLKVYFGKPGRRSVAAYARRLEPVQGKAIRIAPVLDGSIRGGYSGSLKGFNELSPKMARNFADKVARRMCAEPNVDGVQFDLEPFDVSKKNGQYYFYRRIAADFAGSVGREGHDPFHCVDEAHPHGRYFSVFGAAHDLDPDKPSGHHVRAIMTEYHNGFFIAALYDLSARPGGTLTTPEAYAKKARKQASKARRDASRLGVPYQLAIPAAASAHEYAQCHGDPCRESDHAGQSQLDYLRASIQAIKASGADEDANYLGAVVWAWSHSIGHGGARFSPARPTQKELDYLQRHM